MSTTCADHLIARLTEWVVTRIFGYPGDGINGVMGALGRAKDHMRFIQVRHEEMAAFMACAHAKFTGEVGICLATSGPGAIHLLNGLYDAKMDHQPVDAIVGQQALTALGGSYQQEVDLAALFKDVAHEYVQMVSEPAQIRHVIDRAIRIARSERTVTCVIIPNDRQELPAQKNSRLIPKLSDIQTAAAILNAGEKVAILVGAGALRASEAVEKIAEVLGAGVAKALLGKAVLSDDMPYVTGAIGLLGTKPSWNLMQECDTLLNGNLGAARDEW